MKLKVFLIILLSTFTKVFGVNVLYIGAIASPSHFIWNRVLAVAVAEKGHNVTFIGPDEDKLRKPKNYTHILLKGVYDKLDQEYSVNDFALMSPIEMQKALADWSLFQCQLYLKSNDLKRLLNYPEDFQFDLILIDITISFCLYPLIHRFNYPPTIAVTAFLLPHHISYNFGNQLVPSYLPWWGLPYSKKMNFLERVYNFILTYWDILHKNIIQHSREWELSKEIFGDDVPSSLQLEKHISLVLSNIDPILYYPQPTPPNIIPVGGLHTRKSKKLPEDLQNILDNNKNGIILFSLGTNIRSDQLDRRIQKELLGAFRQLPQTIIWKFESEIDTLPKNVIVRKWLPQNDILGHPNIKLFIGHGGALSTQEAIFHGVPIVVVPFVADQHINSRIIVEKKFGVEINFNQITSEYVLKKLRQVLDNPEFADNIKKASQRFRDRTETPLERAIFWIEYVLRHGGAEFLNTQARDMPFYKSTSLDVVAFLFLIFSVIIFSIYHIFSFIFLRRTPKVKMH